MVASNETSPFDDPVLRREAGEGWHPDGLHTALLGAIVMCDGYRQTIEELEQEGLPVPPTLSDNYEHYASHIERLKEHYQIGEPPPLPTDEA